MSKIIGTCLGEYVKEGDVLYDPQTDTYKIKAGDRLVEIDGHVLQSESLRTLQEALSNVDDENIKIDMLGSWAKDLDAKYRRTYLGDWGPDRTDEAKTAVEAAAEAEAEARAKARFAEARARMSEAKAMSSKTAAAAGPAGAPFDSQSFDPLRARVEAETDSGAWKIDGLGARIRPVDTGDWNVRFTDKAAEKLRENSVYGSGVGTASHTSAPWDDPLKDQIDKASNTVACCDLPELKPDYNPNDKVKVYYHDRFPSIPIRSIIDDAIELLNNKKNLHISKISLHNEKFSDKDYRLAISSRIPERPGYIKTLEVAINHTAFDRAYKTELDGYAKLKARLDTNTYIKLRIAFLLYQALKLRDEDARKISLDIFRIIGSDTRPGFHF